MARTKAGKPEESIADKRKEAIIDAAMRLAADGTWDHIRLSDIAAEAGETLADMRADFDSKAAILHGLTARIDRIVLAGDDPDMAGEPARDRLFDVLMRRFEAMRPYRAALRSVMRAYRRDPFAMATFNVRLRRSMKWMLEAAGIDATGRLGDIRAQGLVFVWARTMPVFLRDRDPGMARTMAALDRALRDGEQVMRTMRGGLRAVGALGSLLAGLRERARSYDRDEDWDDDSIYGDDPGDAGERPHASEPDTGGPH